MKKLSLFFILSFSLAILPTFLSIPSGELVAQEEEKRKTKKVGAMTEKVAKKLSAAQELIEDEKIAEGIQELNAIMAFKKLTDYERAQVNYFFGYVEYIKENYEGAISFYRKVLEDDRVPEGLISSARTTIAQLYFQLEDYPKTISSVDEILKNQTTPRPDLYILKGTAQYQMKQFNKTIESVSEAITLAESRNADRVTQLQKNVTSAAGKYRVKYDRNNIDYIFLANEVKKVLKLQLEDTRKGNDKYVQLEEEIKGLQADVKNLAIGPTKEQWWLLLRASYYELEQMDQVKRILERLVVEWSKKEYWVQLSAMYSQDRQESEQIAAYQTAYQEGYLEKSSEFVMMAQLYLTQEAPYEAAKLLQKAVDDGIVDTDDEKNWIVLAQAWFLAKYDEKAIIALREAAKLTDDGELDMRLARSLSNVGDYSGCIESANTGISKGSLKRLDESYITKGMCEFEAAKYEDSKNSFANAKIDADIRNDIALQQCAESENLTLDALLVKMETQKAFLEMGKEIEEKVIRCQLPSSVKTVENWSKFLEKEVERVTLLQNQIAAIEARLASDESQALTF
ncbi:MAG: hypothetical protein QF513_00010 [Gammaproteobacteria bacterium]|jgi:hypothetical protein|nr:hypothetical protein [Gammaproteobacteria bacterium]MDP6146163.1 hypothetical protein [Gammaproteobacteria bacterium]HJL80583.1 hypothetical protein [Gammaproteobacteria bacterium]HJM09041.1 hypothetical protein [Gammaproteobacteria bacterium]HJN00129.1 hypothetical protein [Gammaproteobacteria bacterium]|tara:strand:+ start:9749 stop:11455 length:1707 start_codon:yes stop_codon:yes gene_type:complete